jgi:hypothetical protein
MLATAITTKNTLFPYANEGQLILMEYARLVVSFSTPAYNIFVQLGRQ